MFVVPLACLGYEVVSVAFLTFCAAQRLGDCQRQHRSKPNELSPLLLTLLSHSSRVIHPLELSYISFIPPLFIHPFNYPFIFHISIDLCSIHHPALLVCTSPTFIVLSHLSLTLFYLCVYVGQCVLAVPSKLASCCIICPSLLFLASSILISVMILMFIKTCRWLTMYPMQGGRQTSA